MTAPDGGQGPLPDRTRDTGPQHLPLPEAIFVLGHDESGRTRYHPTLLDAVIAGALLAELTIDAAVRVDDDGRLTVVAEPSGARELREAALRAIADTPGRYPLDDWLGRLAPDATSSTGEAMERAGLCTRQSVRRLGLFRATRIQLTDHSQLGRTETWFNSALTWAESLTPTDAVLASLGRELGAQPPAYADLPAETRRWRRELINGAMTEPVRRVVSATHAAITSSAFGVYR